MSYTREQRRIIRLSNQLSAGYGPRIRKSLLEAEAVESSFRNLNYGDRDSQGVLQQRPSTGWGAPGNAAQDIRQYLTRAQAVVRNGFHGTAGQLAQAVQRSAFPDRYDQHRSEVERLLQGTPGTGGPPQLPGVPTQSRKMSRVADALLNPKTAHDPLRLVSAIRSAQEAAGPPSSPAASPPAHDAPVRGGITYKGQRLTHDTDGLPGYPAVDEFAKAGTPFLAPENGHVVRHSGHGGTSGNVFGYSVYFQGDSGKEYFITHLGPNRAPLGRVRKGAPLGRVSKWTSGPSHAHVGIHG